MADTLAPSSNRAESAAATLRLPGGLAARLLVAPVVSSSPRAHTTHSSRHPAEFQERFIGKTGTGSAFANMPPVRRQPTPPGQRPLSPDAGGDRCGIGRSWVIMACVRAQARHATRTCSR